MTLIFDRRVELAASAGLHALVAGVGGYPHLAGYDGAPPPMDFPRRLYNMGQLSSTIPTALKIIDWLLQHQDDLVVPLATIRTVLSPLPGFALPDYPLLGGASIDRCQREKFNSAANEWRNDACAQQDNVALFYFCGHGLQRTRGDSVLLMEDFGDGDGGTLHKSISSGNLYRGMCNSTQFPNYARTQLFFIDACRTSPDDFKAFEIMSVPDLWDIELGGADLRIAPAFYAARSGTIANGLANDVSLFGKALLDCMENDAADLADDNVTWQVSTMSLTSMLQPAIDKLNAQYGGDQQIVIDGNGRNTTLRVLPGKPMVPIELLVEPLPAAQCVDVVVMDEQSQTVFQRQRPFSPNPYTHQLEGGFYRISVQPDTPRYRPTQQIRRVKPPSADVRLTLATNEPGTV